MKLENYHAQINTNRSIAVLPLVKTEIIVFIVRPIKEVTCNNNINNNICRIFRELWWLGGYYFFCHKDTRAQSITKYY